MTPKDETKTKQENLNIQLTELKQATRKLMVISTITLLNTIYKQTAELTGTLLNPLHIVQTTINKSL